MSATEKKDLWFGLSMFLAGSIVSFVLLMIFQPSSIVGGGNIVAPVVPQAPAPQVNIQDALVSVAKGIGLDEADFKTCLASTKYDQKITNEQMGGQNAGVNGTPGNIIFHMKSKNARLLSGAMPIAIFKKNIDEMLANPNAQSTDPNATAASNVPPVDISKDHIRGNKNAAIAIIEYTDYECPFCKRVHPTYKQLLADYGDKVMWVARHFPLPPTMHPNAKILAVGVECANELGGSDAYWQFTDEIMSGNKI